MKWKHLSFSKNSQQLWEAKAFAFPPHLLQLLFWHGTRRKEHSKKLANVKLWLSLPPRNNFCLFNSGIMKPGGGDDGGYFGQYNSFLNKNEKKGTTFNNMIVCRLCGFRKFRWSFEQTNIIWFVLLWAMWENFAQRRTFDLYIYDGFKSLGALKSFLILRASICWTHV